ncbi:TPA: restriction endonuclease [Staphylococcus aureus]|nr:restriction endonuclease [Staphylococcus aureus]
MTNLNNQLKEFKNTIKVERSKLLPSPFDMVYKNFEKLGYHKQNEQFFYDNASIIIDELRNQSWIEFKKIEKEFSKKLYSHLLDQDSENYKNMTVKEGIEKFTSKHTDEIYALQLSNTQSRRSRAGKEFESIIELVLMGANIEFVTQGSIGSGVFESSELAKLVDCVVPGAAEYNLNKRNTSLISAKTSLRERWQEVGDEMSRTKAKEMYLVTLDESISEKTLKLIEKNNIIIVTTKSVIDKNYLNSSIVISFEDMLNELHIQLLQWNNYGYPATELNNKKELYQTLIEKYDGNMFVRNYYENMLSNINV